MTHPEGFQRDRPAQHEYEVQSKGAENKRGFSSCLKYATCSISTGTRRGNSSEYLTHSENRGREPLKKSMFHFSSETWHQFSDP